MRVEIVYPRRKISAKGRRFLNAAIADCPHEHIVTHEPQGGADCLLVYGASAEREGIAKYRHWFALDLGYWYRIKPDYAMRLSYNADHPQAWLDRDYGRRGFPNLSNDYDPNGPVVVVGNGRKSMSAIYGERPQEWEARQVEKAKALGRKVMYRPKPGYPGLGGVTCPRGPIRQVLRGASLVVTRHSNVGIDAIIQGIPVATDDGAARALYGNDWNANPATVSQRRKFLERLAWFNWQPSECRDFWRHIERLFRIGSSTDS